MNYNKFDGKDKRMFFSQLYSLIISGLSFSKSFSLIVESSDRRHIALYSTIFDNVIKGNTLWQSMMDSMKFSELDYSVVRIGEETGKLPEALNFLADYYQRKEELKRMCTNALSYPVITMCIACIVLSFMLLVVVPMFEQVYTRMGGELPSVTKMIISISEHAPVFLTALSITVIIIFALKNIYKDSSTYKEWTSSAILKIPFIGELIKKYQISRFCRILYLLVISDVPLINALRLMSGIVSFYPFHVSIDTICLRLEHGETFADGLNKYISLYGKKAVTLLKVGEETGSLGNMLFNLGNDMENDLQYSIRQLNNIIEPMLILFIGIVVAFILIAMYMPMFKLGITFQ